MRLKNPLNGFKYAVEGVAHVFRTQRHMRFHFLVLILVLLASLVFHLERSEILVLLFTVTLVLMAEMFNTAVEAVVDLVTQTYHPLAKFAKDIAAGAVLITVINAFIVGLLLFFGGRNWPDLAKQVDISSPRPDTIIVIGAILLAVLVIMGKVRGRKGKLWKGGVVSAHSAIGFFLATTVLWVSKNAAAAIIAFAMAAIIAQSRVEAKIHTLQEVILGGLLATGLTGAVYWIIIVSPKHH